MNDDPNKKDDPFAEPDMPGGAVDDQHDMPEDMDFNDPGLVDEEPYDAEADEFIEEDWEDFDDEFVEEGPEEALAAKRKKSKRLNNIIIGGGVVVALGVFLLQMGGTPAEAPQQVLDPAQQQASQLAMQETERTRPPQGRERPDDYSQRDIIFGKAGQARPTDTGQEVRTGLLNNPELVKEVEQETRTADFDDLYFYEEELEQAQAALEADRHALEAAHNAPPQPEFDINQLPQPAPIAANQQQQQQQAAAGESVLTPMDFDMPIPRQEEAGVADIMAGNNIPRSPDAGGLDRDEPGSMMATEYADADPFLDAAYDDYDAVDDYGAAPVQAGAVSVSDTESAPAAAMDQGALAMLSAQLSEISGRLGAMEDQKNEIGNLAQALEKIEARLDRMETSPAAASTGARTARTTTTATAPAPAPAPPRAAASPPPAANWVLKAAQPGRAMVARAGEQQTYNIAVGDSLAGIGTVREIVLENGRWVVKGSVGRIAQ